MPSSLQKLSLRDPKIEEKLFPHLYPYGKGGYNFSLQKHDVNSGEKHVTHVKIRLMHADSQWRHDKLWPFFAYDWVMKHRILLYNACPRIAVENENRDVSLTKEYVLSELGDGEKVHHRLGQYVPPNLPGTKKYWAKEYIDLTAFVRSVACLTFL